MAGMGQAGEPVFVQTLVPQSAVERFDIGVLIGFAWLDQLQRHAVAIGPDGVQLLRDWAHLRGLRLNVLAPTATAATPAQRQHPVDVLPSLFQCDES